MIKKSLFAFLFCFLIGNTYLWFVKPLRLQPQHQYHENLCKAERFVLNDKNIEVAILGSSLGNRINQDLLPHGWTKLTFSGLSTLEGLELVNRSTKNNVKCVLLEINVLSRPQNEAFLKDVYPPVISELKRLFPVFQVKNQPVSLLYPSLAYLCYGTQKRVGTLFNKKETKLIHNSKALPEISFENNAKIEIPNSKPQSHTNPIFHNKFSDYCKELDSNLVKFRLNQIETYIQQFEKKHIKIIFYEMPVDQQLRTLPLSGQIRRRFYEKFPTEKYPYIVASDSLIFNTSDGIHLTGESINEYTLFFIDQVKKNY